MSNYLLFIVLCGLTSCYCANILHLMPIISKSHHVLHAVLVNELAARGHQVIYVSPYIEKNPHPNVRQILLEKVSETLHESMDHVSMSDNSSPQMVDDILGYSLVACELLFNSAGFKELQRVIKTEKFDLIINDYGLCDCFLGVIHAVPDVPVVGLTAYGGAVFTNTITGNPESLAVKPLVTAMKHGKLYFLDRVYNSLVHLYTIIIHRIYYLPKEDQIMQSVFPRAPSILQLYSRYNLLLLNDHFTLTPPTPTVPGLVHIAGLHIQPPKPLPEDIKTFLDNSEHGAVFFSLGTNVYSSKLGDEKLNIIMESLKELAPVRVLWKFEKKDLPGKPDNVMIGPWLPQSDILAHPNVKLFITHGGLLSTLEALQRKVPLVGIPFLVDQHLNLKRAVADGYAERLDYGTLSKDEFVSTLRKVLTDTKYQMNADKLGAVFADQPQPPLQRAVYWIEYVIRHKGAKHLRSDSLDLTWYQNELLDVALFLLVIFYIVVKSVVCILKLVVRLLFSSNKNKIKTN